MRGVFGMLQEADSCDARARASVHRRARGAARVDPRASSPSELRPHATEWEDARWFPDEVFAAWREHGLPRAEVPGGATAARAATTCTRRCSPRSSRGCGSGGLAAGIGAHVGIATPPIWKFGTDDQKQRYLRPAIAGAKIAALGDHRARRRLRRRRHPDARQAGRRRLAWSTARRCSSPTACARTSSSRAREDDRRGRPPRPQLPDRRQRPDGVERVARSRSSAGTPPTPALIAFDDVFVPDENLLGARERGLLPDHGQLPVGAAADGARRRRGDAASPTSSTVAFAERAPRLRPAADRPPGVRHKLADLATTRLRRARP